MEADLKKKEPKSKVKKIKSMDELAQVIEIKEETPVEVLKWRSKEGEIPITEMENQHLARASVTMLTRFTRYHQAIKDNNVEIEELGKKSFIIKNDLKYHKDRLLKIQEEIDRTERELYDAEQEIEKVKHKNVLNRQTIDTNQKLYNAIQAELGHRGESTSSILGPAPEKNYNTDLYEKSNY